MTRGPQETCTLLDWQLEARWDNAEHLKSPQVSPLRQLNEVVDVYFKIGWKLSTLTNSLGCGYLSHRQTPTSECLNQWAESHPKISGTDTPEGNTIKSQTRWESSVTGLLGHGGRTRGMWVSKLNPSFVGSCFSNCMAKPSYDDVSRGLTCRSVEWSQAEGYCQGIHRSTETGHHRCWQSSAVPHPTICAGAVTAKWTPGHCPPATHPQAPSQEGQGCQAHTAQVTKWWLQWSFH